MDLKKIQEEIQNQFKASKQLLSFDEYCKLLGQNAKSQIRGSAEYTADMMDQF